MSSRQASAKLRAESTWQRSYSHERRRQVQNPHEVERTRPHGSTCVAASSKGMHREFGGILSFLFFFLARGDTGPLSVGWGAQKVERVQGRKSASFQWAIKPPVITSQAKRTWNARSSLIETCTTTSFRHGASRVARARGSTHVTTETSRRH